MKLNEPQRMAVESCVENNVVVIAGAGSGKTRVLTHAAAHLVKSGVDPHNILLLTFTNRAAGEMRDRATEMIGGKKSPIWASTFHSFGARILRKSGSWVGLDADYSILDQSDSNSILVAARKELWPSKEAADAVLPRTAVVAEAISAACSLLVPFPKYVDQLHHPPETKQAMVKVYQMYEEHKRKCNQLDFDDLLYYMFKLLGEKEPRVKLRKRFRHILVDEYQDTNHIQARIVYRLIGKNNRFMVVGDDAQTIYTWRHAKHTNLFEIAEKYEGTQVVKMEQNYRSTQAVLDLANAFQCASTTTSSPRPRPSSKRSGRTRPTGCPSMTSQCSTAPTGALPFWRSSCCGPRSPTRSTAARTSTRHPTSRTWCLTSALSPTRGTPKPASGRSSSAPRSASSPPRRSSSSRGPS
jgi:DNA helicase-2/ATP-dependent DNA helicase PcrA